MRIDIKKIKDFPSSKIVIFLILIMNVIFIFNKHDYLRKDRVIVWDIISYYAYLPSTFIYQDLTLSFMDDPEETRNYVIWADPVENGNKCIRTTYGMSAMYSPFFFMAHGVAKVFSIDAGGYSWPYKLALLISCIFYLTLALFVLRKVLLKHFNEWTVSITLICLFFGTNLYYYSTNEAPMSHAFSFSLICFFVYLVEKWHEKPNFKFSIFIGLLSGLIVLIRPTNIVVLLFFVLYKIKDVKTAKERFALLLKNSHLILLMGVLAFLVWLPQMIYWKSITGSWLYNSYGDSFYFNNPQIINGLFSYRKGWLLYTPMMFLSILGMIFLFRKFRIYFFAVLIYFTVFIYVIFSWWSWWYGGGFSIRAMVDSYGILAIPFAAFFDWVLQQRKLSIKLPVFILTAWLIFFSIFNTSQYRKQLIHYDSMTKESYWAVFLKLKRPANYYDLVAKPDYDMARKGIYVTK